MVHFIMEAVGLLDLSWAKVNERGTSSGWTKSLKHLSPPWEGATSPYTHPQHSTKSRFQARRAARDLKSFIRHFHTSHVFTSPHHTESDCKIAHLPRILRAQAIRPKPLTLEDANRITKTFIDYCDLVRLHSTSRYIVPSENLANRRRFIFQHRAVKLEAAHRIRKRRRQQLAAAEA